MIDTTVTNVMHDIHPSPRECRERIHQRVRIAKSRRMTKMLRSLSNHEVTASTTVVRDATPPRTRQCTPTSLVVWIVRSPKLQKVQSLRTQSRIPGMLAVA